MKRLRGRIGEVVLIAVGVVLGLSAESWLGTLGERQREHEYLQDLRAEVEVNRAHLADVREGAERRKRLGGAVLASSIAGGGFPDSLSGADFKYLFELNTVRPRTATTKQLVSSGEIGIIRSPEVRAAIATWDRGTGIAEVLTTFQRAHWSEVTQRMFMEVDEFAAFYSEFWDGEVEGLTMDPSPVVNTKRFRDALAARLIDTEDVFVVLDDYIIPDLDQLDTALENVGY